MLSFDPLESAPGQLQKIGGAWAKASAGGKIVSGAGEAETFVVSDDLEVRDA